MCSLKVIISFSCSFSSCPSAFWCSCFILSSEIKEFPENWTEKYAAVKAEGATLFHTALTFRNGIINNVLMFLSRQIKV